MVCAPNACADYLVLRSGARLNATCTIVSGFKNATPLSMKSC